MTLHLILPAIVLFVLGSVSTRYARIRYQSPQVNSNGFKVLGGILYFFGAMLIAILLITKGP